MSFLDKIFKKADNPVINTNIDLLPSILESKLTSKRKELEMISAKNMSEIKYLYEKSKVLLVDIKEKNLEDKPNERLNKAAVTAKTQMENQLEKILDKINPLNIGTDLENIYGYSRESYVFLFNEINSYRKSIVYISIYLKDEMKNLGSNLQELLNKFQEMNDLFSKEQNVFFFEKTKKNIEQIKENNIEIEKKENEIKNIENETKNIENEIKTIVQDLVKLKESEESKKIDLLNEQKSKFFNEKQSLKVELSSMISTVDKPLQRFASLVDSGRWKINKEDKELLDCFIINPILALKKDVNGKQIKSILEEVKKAIEDEKIELKEKEREKRMDALVELINFDFFGRIFWKVNEIQKEVNEIDAIINKSKVLKDIEKKENSILDLKQKVESKNSEIKTILSQINSLKQKNDENIEKISEFAQKALGKKIVLQN